MYKRPKRPRQNFAEYPDYEGRPDYIEADHRQIYHQATQAYQAKAKEYAPSLKHLRSARQVRYLFQTIVPSFHLGVTYAKFLVGHRFDGRH